MFWSRKARITPPANPLPPPVSADFANTTPPSVIDHAQLEDLMVQLINTERGLARRDYLMQDEYLSIAAEKHSTWMLATDTFSHTGLNASTPTARMKAAGYQLIGSWSTGENIAWASIRNPAGLKDELELLHRNLMNSPGHRANILSTKFREVGIGFEIGEYRGMQAAFVTQCFGRNS